MKSQAASTACGPPLVRSPFLWDTVSSALLGLFLACSGCVWCEPAAPEWYQALSRPAGSFLAYLLGAQAMCAVQCPAISVSGHEHSDWRQPPLASLSLTMRRFPAAAID